MDIRILKTEQLPEQMGQLAKLAQQEGYDFINKLIDEYQSGKNKFDQQGEALLVAFDETKLVACGGLNQQWGDKEIEARIGRVRRFYVHPDYRKHAIGKQLLIALEQEAKAHFSALCLNTDIRGAADFYQKQNYVFVENHPNYNYFKYLV